MTRGPRAPLLLVCLMLAAAPPALAQKKTCGKLLLVERWNGHFTLTASVTDQLKLPSLGGAGMEHRYSWSAGGEIELRPAMDEGRRLETEWHGDDQSFTATSEEHERPIGGGDQDQYRVVLRSGALEENANSAHLDLNCEKGTYWFGVNVGDFKVKRTLELAPSLVSTCEGAKRRDPGQDPGAVTAQMNCALVESKKAEFDKGTLTFAVSASVKDQAFSPDNPTLSGNAKVESNHSLMNGKPLEVQLTWSLSPGPPGKAELVFDFEKPEEYDGWLPAPPAPRPGQPDDSNGVRYGGQPLRARVRLKSKKPDGGTPSGRIDFSLEEISSHAGRCNNFPRGVAMKDDLRFARQEDQPDPNVVVDGDTRAHTRQDVSEAVVAIEALDTGAYGKLRARCEKLSLTAEFKATGKPYLAVPRDDDGNHVADAWEKPLGERHPTDWDEDDQPADQEESGDGMSLYREYRGFVVLSGGGKTFRRMDPRRKELFVIDPQGVFDPGLWEQASGIKAWNVDDTLVQGGGDRNASRVVDYTMGAASGQHKYAVRITVVAGLADPDCPSPAQMGCSRNASSPKGAEFTKIFPDRIAADADTFSAWFASQLADPASNLNRQLPPNLARQILDRLRSPVGRATYIRQWLTFTALHEVGHCCNLEGHVNESRDEADGLGAAGCLMRYLPREEYPGLAAGQMVLTPDAALPAPNMNFCTKPPYSCFWHLNVKD